MSSPDDLPPSVDPDATRYSDDPDATRYSDWPAIPPPTPPLLPSVPGYEVLEELAHGGMGVVYKASQLGFNRIVALKMILSGAHAGTEERARFRIEAEAVARLQHPNIVQVFEVGEHGGQPFFSMEFCPGALDRKLRGTPLPPTEAARLVEILAQAVEAAHQERVIHRDLKPSNVLLAEDGTPKVTDFGLAKRLDEAGRTATGELIGTPSYMAPEQAGGKSREAGPATDVYALGAILYECLTGRPPFKGPTVLDTLAQVLADDPVPPRRLQPKTPRDLETICLKCLEKDPCRRYASARELGERLGLFLAGRPIPDRPINSLEHTWRWCRRNPVLASLAAGILLSLAAGSGMGTWYGVAAERTVQDERRAREDAERTTARTIKEGEQREKERRRAEEEAERERALGRQVRFGAFGTYSLLLRDAQEALRRGNRGKAREILEACDVPFRHWEHDFLLQSCPPCLRTLPAHDDAVVSVAFSLDGQRIVSGSSDRTVKVWNAATGVVSVTFTGHAVSVCAVAISPDGSRVGSGDTDGVVKVWEAATGKEAFTLKRQAGAVNDVVFSPDGERIATASADGDVKLWDANGGKEVISLEGRDEVWGVAFSPDGKRLASGGKDALVRIWDAATGKELRSLRGHQDTVKSVAFSPDGRRLASGSDDCTVRVWDVASGADIFNLERDTQGSVVVRGHTFAVETVAFSRDGRLAVGDEDGTVTLYDLKTGRATLTLQAHDLAVFGVAFSPDGKRLASASLDRTVKLWNVEPDRQPLTVAAVGGTFSPDGKRIASGSPGGGLFIWDAATGEPGSLLAQGGEVKNLAFSPDGKRIASFGVHNSAEVWDASTGDLLFQIKYLEVTCLAFNRDGSRLATGDSDGHVRGWDGGTGEALFDLKGHTGAVESVAFNPDGQLLASGSADGTVKIWDPAIAKELLTLRGHAAEVSSVAFSRDGRRLASGSWDKTIKIWETATGNEVAALRGHLGPVLGVAFSPDGKRLLSGGGSSASGLGAEVKLWDVETGHEALTLAEERDDITGVAFNVDGKRLLAAGADGRVRVWSAGAP